MKNVEDGGHLLFSIVLFLTSLTKKLAQLSAVLDLWEYKGCEMGVSCPFSVLFFPNVLDLRLREKERFLHDAIGTPGSSKSTGHAWHLLTRAFFTSEGAIWCLGISNHCLQLITCFCFHFCSHVGD